MADIADRLSQAESAGNLQIKFLGSIARHMEDP